MNKVKLGEILDVKRGASLSGKFYSTSGEKIRLTLGNFDYPNGGFKKNTSKTDIYFTGSVKKEFILNEGDIITPLTEQVAGLLGETARIPESNVYIQSGDIGLIIPDESVLDKNFAYYLVSSPLIKKQLSDSAQQTKIRHTSPDKIKSCEAWIPDLKIQNKIAVMLDSLNNKIENNNKINEELEKLARTIYTYWFLQFDFPNSNGNPYKTSGGKMVWNEDLNREIPEGWKVQNLKDNDFTEIINPGIEKFENKKIYIATGDVNRNNINTGTNITYEKRESRANMQPIPNSVWFAKMKNSIKHIYIGTYSKNIIQNNIFSTGFLGLKCLSENYLEYINCFINSSYFETKKDQLAHGATQEAVNNQDIKLIQLLIPNSKIIEKFHQTTKEIFEKINNNNEENNKLKELKEFLAPLLMNGQVTFKTNNKLK